MRKNRSYGELREISDDIVCAAAEAACAAEFINKMPEGMKTFIGEHGARLSGGQRQRLALARAVLTKPQILILDEATRSLDSESEQLIQRYLTDIRGTCTMLVVAHRLSTLQYCDLIYELKEGRLIRSGSPQEMLNLKKV